MENFLKSISISLCLIASIPGKAQSGLFDDNKIYSQTDTLIRFIELDSQTNRYRVGHFTNYWYTTGATRPLFYPNNGPWKQVGLTLLVDEYPGLKAVKGDLEIPPYMQAGVYTAGTMMIFNNRCYQSKWTTSASPETNDQAWDRINCPVEQTASLAALDTVDTASSMPATENTDIDSGTPSEAIQQNETTQGTETTEQTIISQPDTIENNDGHTAPDCSLANVTPWSQEGTYFAGTVVTHHQGKLYRAKWWTQDEPPLTPPNEAWVTAWSTLSDCAELAQDDNTDDDTASNPPDTGDGETITPTKPVITDPPMALPNEGYAFLQLLDDADWDWLFPLRSGKFVEKTPCQPHQFLDCGGGARNDGSGDKFTLSAFINAVLTYNQWAELNNYKQFLNEGTVKQQAQEFIAFWAKSSRETSGSWQTASAPWIVSHDIGEETIWAWKGGLYWVEEVGYSTDPATGKSPIINYVDSGSSLYPPAPERSYYGRGIIQLSWNYNYGAFSYWLYDNGLLPDIIDSRDKLLMFPNLVADEGTLSIMSGIWFWMTAQGAKPSSHDVIHGNVSHISETTQQQGLPQSHSLNNAAIPTAQGDTLDQAVFAYRLGTAINIVNGGLECNKAAAYHQGPVQRVFYYDAYAAYLNDKYRLNAIRIDAARASTKDAWRTTVNEMSPLNLQSATCYNQRAYYGW